MGKISVLLTIFASTIFCFGCEKNDVDANPGINYVGGGNKNKNFKYEGTISAEVLNNYLSRSILQAEFLSSRDFTAYDYEADDERMIINIGAKFVGRAQYAWGWESRFADPRWLTFAKAKIDRMHEKDPDIIFQAGIFEIVTTDVQSVPIPAWVFEDFDLPVEIRNFRQAAMRFGDGKYENHWQAGHDVPDITKLETQMFFYYMAVEYMKAGFEALHFGQVRLVGETDATLEWSNWRSLLFKIREKAKTITRRKMVLCDGHCNNMVVDGELIFDFCSYPLRLKENQGDPKKAMISKFYLDSVYGLTVGGKTPSGWTCARSPYLVEFDNFGISNHPGKANLNDHFVWGYDEISWLYLQTPQYQSEVIAGIVDYIGRVDPVGFLEMSGSRVVVLENNEVKCYRCNTKSEECPVGASQEETIKQIWGTNK